MNNDIVDFKFEFLNPEGHPASYIGTSNGNVFEGSRLCRDECGGTNSTVEFITGSMTISDDEASKKLWVTGTTTLTLPLGLSWDNSSETEVVNIGSDVVTIDTLGGVMVNEDTGSLSLGAYEYVNLAKIAADQYFGKGTFSSGGGVI